MSPEITRLVLCLFIPLITLAQPEKRKWVDSVYSSLSTEERIGQLMMVAAYSNKGTGHEAELTELIEEYGIGGLIFFQGGPMRQARLQNRLQEKSSVPMLIGIDGEWGLNMRLDSTLQFPYAMTLGAVQNNDLIFRMGHEIGRQCKEMGIHVNFAPVVDINSNPENPVIGYRSFGENREDVSKKSVSYIKGLQRAGVMACAKHFPGHGDTDKDSHLTLPTVSHSVDRLDSVELFPFKKAINGGVESIMVAHLNVPALSKSAEMPSTLSPAIVNDLLKKRLGFKGLVFTDALNMKGVANYYEPGELEVLALKAGNDILLFPEDVPKAIKEIRRAIRKKELNEKEIEKTVRKILAAKYDAGLAEYQPIQTDGLMVRLNTPGAEALIQDLYGASVTAFNSRRILPLKKLDTLRIATLAIGSEEPKNIFQQYAGYYAPMIHYHTPYQMSANQRVELLNDLKQFNLILVSLHGNTRTRSANYKVNPEIAILLRQLKSVSEVIPSVLANPYAAAYFDDFDPLLIIGEDNEVTQKILPQVIFGGQEANGRLPVTVSNSLPAGAGDLILPNGRFGFALPENVYMDSNFLTRSIDRLAEDAIQGKATPGCQIWVARGGQVVFHKNYGFQTYDSLIPVDDQSIYDVASITKVAATLQSVMFLEERDLLKLDKRIVNYLPELRRTNKKNMDLRHILTHQAGLKPYIPFWKKTLMEEGLDTTVYRLERDTNYPYEVATGLYGHQSLSDSIWKWTLESDLLEKSLFKPYPYTYSDMGYYLMHRMCEEILNQPMDSFLEQNIYSPLGMGHTGYNPLCRHSEQQIVPTEQDDYFRDRTIRGTVHDQGAAMYGGVAGHAGLFSNANDLTKLMMMNLRDGFYGGERYFFPGTIYKFSQPQFKNNRRGMGWDRPMATAGKGPTGGFVSYASFGHTGFTGTMIWADPDYDLVYVFLSNRTYPSSDNAKLITRNIRTRIQDAIYKSIFEFEKYNL